MGKLKTKPVALAGVAVLASKFLLLDKLRKPKPKPKRKLVKAAKIGIPSIVAMGAGGAIFRKKKAGSKSRNFSLVGGAGPAPTTNSQTRPSATPPASQPATEAKK